MRRRSISAYRVHAWRLASRNDEVVDSSDNVEVPLSLGEGGLWIQLQRRSRGSRKGRNVRRCCFREEASAANVEKHCGCP